MKRPKLLFLTSRFPYPLEKGDKLRAYHLLLNLSKNFDIYLFAIHEETPKNEWIEKLSVYCRGIKTVVINRKQSVLAMLKYQQLPFQVAYFYSEKAKIILTDYLSEVEPDAIFCHLIRMSEYVRGITGLPKILDYMDAFSKGMERMQSGSSWWMKLPASIEKKRLVKYENEIFNTFDYHIIISNQDRAHIPHPQRDRIEIIPNGVDFNFFKPQNVVKKYDLLFNGHMSYPPNIASALYTAKAIFPLVKSQSPSATLLIAGADPVNKIKRLNGSGITVTGWVEDIRTVYASSRLLIAPMLISIGLQNKILQAMAMKIPCVISKMANNALGATHGKHLFVAETPAEYNQYIQLLLSDKKIYEQIAESAYQFVLSNFTWEENTEIISRKIKELLLNRGQ